MSKRALIHCNADLQQGMGHLARSLCLAEEASSRGWHVTIAGLFGGRALEHAEAMVPGQTLVSLDTRSPHAHLRELAAKTSAELVHLDSYDTALDDFTFGSALISNMQDGTFGRRRADLHIDANLDAELRYRECEAGERALIGAAGMQIRPAVRKLSHEVRASGSEPYQVLLLLGGTDPFNLTPKLTHMLAVHAELQLTVISRPEAHAEIEEALRPGLRDRVRLIPFTENLPALADSMDLVVTAAGTSVWDFAAAGIPMGIIAVTDNQLPGYRASKENGLGIALGEPPHTDLEERISFLIEATKQGEQLRGLAARGPALVDGLGSWRVVSAWEELLEVGLHKTRRVETSLEQTLTARPATETDAKRLFDWRNDETTRLVSRTSEPLHWESHVAWVERTLADPGRKLLIIEQNNEAIATIRWDDLGDLTWEVSISLAPEQRGKGLAAAVLAAGERALTDLAPVKLRAGIHISNEASRRLFARAGYLPNLPADANGFEGREKWLLPEPR